MSGKFQVTPSATLSPTERLAQPTLPAVPSQADHGAQAYWLSCLPCHGDRGQGLTDEFRETYPPEEQYCWERGCHGERPYDSGFTLPMHIPAIIGPQAALGKFANAATLHAYIQAAMPYWKPGSLTEEESWRVTAFLLRENGIPFKESLDASNAEQVLISTGGVPSTPSLQPVTTEPVQQARTVHPGWFFALVIFVALVIAVVSAHKRSVDSL